MRALIPGLLLLIVTVPAAAGTIYGKVTVNGKLVKGWEVVAQYTVREEAKTIQSSTDAKGRYRLRTADGAIQLFVISPDGKSKTPQLRLTSYSRPIKYNLAITAKQGKDGKGDTLTIKRDG